MKYVLLLCSAALVACSGSVNSPAAVCVVGQDQTCNDDSAAAALWGACQGDGICVCHSGFEPNPSTGRCRPAPDGGASDGGGTDGGGTDGGATACGDMTCMANEFCVQRVHGQDAGPKPPTWMCQNYWNCPEATCACALASFMSASCVSPVCTSSAPVVIRCDDLN